MREKSFCCLGFKKIWEVGGNDLRRGKVGFEFVRVFDGFGKRKETVNGSHWGLEEETELRIEQSLLAFPSQTEEEREQWFYTSGN